VQAAVASALGQDVDSVGRLSPQDLHYCGNDRLSCDTGATLKDTLAQLEKRQLLLEDCLRYQPPDMRGDATQQQLCARSCANTSPLASQGMFSFVRITQLWKAQQHIRKYGAVVSMMMCTHVCTWSDFRVRGVRACLHVGAKEELSECWSRGGCRDGFLLGSTELP
jgi:hypothetical protein